MTSGQHTMLPRLGMTPARGVPIAFLWAISMVLCPSQPILPIVWCILPVTSKVLSPIILTLGTVPWACTCNRCVCRATLHFSNEDPKQCTKYRGSHLIMPHRAQYNDRLYPTILEPWNHHGPLMDPLTGEPCPMEVVGDFKATDPIFKGSYGDSPVFRR